MHDQTISLADMQHLMQIALTGVDPRGESRNDTAVHAHLAPSAQLSAAQCLAIYQRGYYARLLQCLQGQFKALNHALGPPLFADFARQYLHDTPSRSATLAELGRGFAPWLQSNRPDAEEAEKESWIDFMVDLADFEWTLYTLFDAPGAEAKGYASAEQLTHPQLALQPCLRLCHYRYPVSSYYQQVAALEATEHAPAVDIELPAPQESWLALVRKDYKIGIFRLQPAQHHFLQQMAEGAKVEDAIAHTAQTFNKSAAQATLGWQRWREAWGNAGFFVHAFRDS